ncbi:efflux RND transporter permease subunit [Nocardiopsis sp. L17-MgMaSL7]|uniref:efflux RND transporter permease subunit n=1 Tax=Nocardiopsis sp. L17-MgMaSL7 TaxID=1938893 RepID=UPI000D967FA5|nr:efflux RND transporter permease subunit [Nocardiopsis sp. L17-MgMaSL7]PWV58185.1 HAE1 family hydrophobic/amphiphilic exporter-1 [Nocardiopsis sp. L17-MgMaSL7]
MSLGNRALVLLITLAVLLFGVLAAMSSKRELFPEMSLPMVMVSAQYQGATPQVVEGQVTEPLEQALQGVEGVDTITSTSTTGSAQIMAEFDYDRDQDALVRETQVAVDQISGLLPDDASTSVMALSMDMMPVMMLAASSENGDEQSMAASIENVLIPELESVPGVRSANLSGVPDQRVEVTPDEDELSDAGISTQDLADALESSGLLMAGGSIDEDGRSLSVTTGDQLTSLDDIEDVWVQPSQGADPSAAMPGAPPAPAPSPVQISEVADVEMVTEDASSIARLDGNPSVALMVMATPDGNTVEISDGVQDVLDQQSDLLGDDIDLAVVFDQAPFINDSITDMFEAGAYGLAASVIVILVFMLSIRSTLVVAVSIPVSVLAAFVGMQVFGFTLNMLTLAAITIAIGRVVDDSIVVLENIRRHMDYGKERMTAVKDGVREVATAVASSSFATIAVFLPLAFVGGMVGEIFMPFAVTSSLALAGSLLVALTITPVLCYWFLRPAEVGDSSREEIEHAAYQREMRTPLQRAYLPVIRWITTKRKVATVVTLAASVAIFGGTAVMAANSETDWLGEAEENTYTVIQELEPGMSLEAADAEAVKVEEALAGMAWIETYQVNIGGNPMMGGGGDQIDYTITADPDTDQLRNRDVLRDTFDDLDTEYPPRMDSTGGMGGSGIEVRVTAEDQDTLVEAAGMIEDELRGIDGADDVTSGISQSQPALEVHVDGEEAAEYGLNESVVGQTVSAAFNGRDVGDATIEHIRRDVVVLVQDAPGTVAELEELPITTPTGEEIELGDVAEVTEVEQPPELTRIDGVTSTTVSANPTASDLGAVSVEITQALDGIDLPSGATASLGGVSQDQTEGFAQLGLALLAAVIICYLIMVATFKSLMQPLMLLVSVPFAATGSLGLLMLTGTPIGAAALIGMLMLIGIVITNAIVLMDLINQNRKKGMGLSEAIVEGSRHRLRPILMTAVGTIAALVPMATGLAGGGAFVSAPVALVVIGGLVTSTLLTLILVPVLYQLVEVRRQRREARSAERQERRRAKRRARAEAGEASDGTTADGEAGDVPRDQDTATGGTSGS